MGGVQGVMSTAGGLLFRRSVDICLPEYTKPTKGQL